MIDLQLILSTIANKTFWKILGISSIILYIGYIHVRDMQQRKLIDQQVKIIRTLEEKNANLIKNHQEQIIIRNKLEEEKKVEINRAVSLQRKLNKLSSTLFKKDKKGRVIKNINEATKQIKEEFESIK